MTFESEDQGGSVDMSLSSIVHNGLNDALMSTNNSLHWHSPSHAWSKTGIITIQSDLDVVDLAQWDASGLVEYSSGQYSFYANDYSAEGVELFLTHGNGKVDIQTATSWYATYLYLNTIDTILVSNDITDCVKYLLTYI